MRTEFTYFPTVGFLQRLAPSSLKQNLPKAVRLWVILRSIYGADYDEVKLDLPEQFTYKAWRNQFFTQVYDETQQKSSENIHRKRDEIPSLHDTQCNCAKLLTHWLFDQNSNLTISREKWQESFLQIYPMEKSQLDKLLALGTDATSEENTQQQDLPKKPLTSSLNVTSKKVKTYVPPCPEGRLFAVTGKSLESDFNALIKMGWLDIPSVKTGSEKYYQKVKNFPEFDGFNKNISTVNFINQPDFVEIADNYFQAINGIQRFLMHVDYVVSKEAIDKISILQDRLKEIWGKKLIPPVSIFYDSASLGIEGTRIVYPVCIYYFQRAPYLCTFGQKLKKKQQIDWHNYRLDRIQALEELSWDDEQVPEELKKKCLDRQPPCPEDIQAKMTEAWGFDFYQPSRKMLLRFDRDFHDRYIINSFRHDTFTFIQTKADFQRFMKEYTPNQSEQERLKEILKDLPAQPDESERSYAYYSAAYRVDDFNLIDNSVMMRLRAWGPKVEVLLPNDLRSRMVKDIQDTWNLYTRSIP